MSQEAHVDADKLPEDLRKIIEESRNMGFDIDDNVLLEKLVIYIVHRDHKVFEHGIKQGKESANGKSK